MSKDRKCNRILGRRQVLKLSGSSFLGVTGLSSFASARESEISHDEFKKINNAAMRIHDRQGPDARTEFLERRGLSGKYIRGKFTVDYGNEEVSTQVRCVDPRQCDGDIDLTLYLTYNRYTSTWFADLNMRYRYSLYNYGMNQIYSGPENPTDVASIQWEGENGKLQPLDNHDMDNQHYEGDFVNWHNGSFNTREGTGFDVDSRGLCWDSGVTSTNSHNYKWSDYTRAGTFLQRGSNYSSGAQITASYVYTEGSGSVSSVTVGFPYAIAVNFSGSVDEEHLQTDLEGNNLIVTT